MRKRHHVHSAAVPPAAPQDAEAAKGVSPGLAGGTEDLGSEPSAGLAGGAEGSAPAAVTEPADVSTAPAAPESVTLGLEREVADQKERLLRLAADFDNFRKRAAREKAETWGRAQGDVIQKILDVIDDLGRVAHLDPAQTGAEALHEGMGLVERKFLKALEGVGLERLDPSGQAFDPNAHEAVMTTPTPSLDLDGMVAMVFQSGYRLNGVLLRPARVSVFAYAEAAPGEAVH
jgi:molecular chaperone GrpE